MSSRLKKQRVAFTLVELLVVMTIIVIILGIGIGGIREMRGAALTQMGGAELTTATKRAQKTAVKNQIPGSIMLQVANSGASQGYLMASDPELEVYFGFDKISTTSPLIGLAYGKTNDQALNIDPSKLTVGMFGSGYYMDSGNLSSIGLSMGSSNVYYLEAQVRYGQGDGSFMKINDVNVNIDSSGGVYGSLGSFNFPGSGNYRPYVGGDRWRKVGVMVSKAFGAMSGNTFAYLFVDGEMIADTKVEALAAKNITIGRSPVSTAKVVIDEIKIYNLMKTEPIMNDLKAGFFISSFINSGNLSKSILINAEGGMINSSNTTIDYIAFASLGLSGKTFSSSSSGGSNAERNYDLNTSSYVVQEPVTNLYYLRVKGAAVPSMPESGYIAVEDSTSKNYELIKYRSFDGLTMVVESRQVANTIKNSNPSQTFYYAIPVIFNSKGLVQ